MTADPFPSIPPKQPVALLDLVETRTPQASRAFVSGIAQVAATVGGRVLLANETIAPMIVPDESVPESDHAIRLLVVTEYPTSKAGGLALAERKRAEHSTEKVRTWALRPASRIEALFGRTLSYTLGLLRRERVPEVRDDPTLESLVKGALILGEQPDEARWKALASLSGDRPIWMLNFLDFAKTAVYANDAPDASISGAHAYRRYGSGMVSSLAAVGGRVGWSGLVIDQLAGPDEGRWHQIAIAVYPSAAAMMTMLALPKYRAAHVHRAAALARTRLLATRPIGGLESAR